MNSLCWNCWWLGNPRSVHALHDMVRRWDPRIVFLLETKLRKRRMERVRDKLGFANGLVMPSQGRSGGLALLWKREVAIVTEVNTSLEWRIIGFYGHP